MDGDTWKVFVALGAGVLGFAGGVLTFLNGRLKEAEGEQERSRVWVITIAVFSVGAMLVGFALSMANDDWGFLVAAPLFLLSYGCFCVLFLKGPHPPHRRDIVMFAAMSVATAISVSLAISLWAVSRVVSLFDHLTK